MNHTEEKANIISHLIGAIVAIPASVLLIVQSLKGNQEFALVSTIVYSLTLTQLFFASSLYHYKYDHVMKEKWRVYDHISIYWLIAGTYTPVCLLSLMDGNGLFILITIWVIALAGTVYKIFFTGRYPYFSLILYLLMSWIIIFDINSLAYSLSSNSFFLVLLGGAFYTVGAVIYGIKRIPYNHFIWHLFVIGGAYSHYFAIYNLVKD